MRSASANRFAVEVVPEALCALIDVIGAKRARRARGERIERGASLGPHHAAGASEATVAERAPDGLMWDARARWPDRDGRARQERRIRSLVMPWLAS